MSSLSIDEFREGSVLPLASEEHHSNDWFGIVLDGRVVYVPRYAVAVKQPPALRGAVTETGTVSLAGAPAPVAPTPTSTTANPVPRRTTSTAPVTVATRLAPVEPIAAPPAAAPVARASAAAPPDVPTALPVATERVPARESAGDAIPSPTPAPERPALSAKRAGVKLTLGVLGTVTLIKTNGLTPTAHVAGLSFVGARYRSLGVYVAPEFGEGGGYRSRMMGGGVSLDLLSVRMLRVTALAGYTNYSETDTSSAPVTSSVQGTSVGGMVSVPFAGPVRIAYRGQYIMARDAGIPVPWARHSVGLVF